MRGKVPVADSLGFRKGAHVRIDGVEGAFVVADVTSGTLTLRPRRWWHRLWAWLRRLRPL